MRHRSLGWRRDLSDIRDFTADHRPIKALLDQSAKLDIASTTAPPVSVDLRPWFSPVEDQKTLGSCHDAQTEVLTDRGFKLFSQLDGSERLATVNPKTGDLFFEVPVRIVRFPYQGKLHCIDNQSLNFKVTPDHQMLVRKWSESARTLNSRYEFVMAKNVGWYAGLLNRVRWSGEIHSDVFTLPGVPHKLKEQRVTKDIPLKSWARFLGIYLAEGTLLKRSQRKGRVSYKIQIAASKPREKSFVRTVLLEIGVHALELKDRFTFSDKRVYEAMSSLGLEGVHAGKKFVPAFVFRLDAETITEFLAGHFAGDGSVQYGIRAHYTGSARLAADLQALIFMSGNETRMTVRKARTSVMTDGRTVVGRLPEHRVSVCERKNLSIERKRSWFTEDYDGLVFCAEVPTFHTLVTRREGKILISGNCTANAAAGLIEYFENRAHGKYLNASRIFIYKATRQLAGEVGDVGAELRTTMRAIAMFGAPEEQYCPYNIAKFDDELAPMLYAMASNFRATQYYRHDPAGADPSKVLASVKTALAAHLPAMFGMTVYSSFPGIGPDDRLGNIPFPTTKDRVAGGHAMVLAGYDDSHKIGPDVGAFLVRNSWGTDVGQAGYFWLAYRQLLSGIVTDLWSIVQESFVDTSLFL